MNKLFEIKDKTGRIIYLTKERWKHIVSEHPKLSNNIEIIKEAIITPLIVKQSKNDEKVNFYYKHFKKVRKYLLVAVKYINGNGFVITSFYVSNIKNER
ncbi:hypothetical protein HYV88_00725 [Candidatus Woesearchaeota archaeon]|nr:hypothetical protein [Candidatus Woesearchaeota archaeon]